MERKTKMLVNCGHKFCARCKTEKPRVEFNKNSSKFDRKDTWCRDCAKAYKKEKRKAKNASM